MMEYFLNKMTSFNFFKTDENIINFFSSKYNTN